jgi:hypothetical protein
MPVKSDFLKGCKFVFLKKMDWRNEQEMNNLKKYGRV